MTINIFPIIHLVETNLTNDNEIVFDSYVITNIIESMNSKDLNIKEKVNRKIYIDRAVRGGHGPRFKIYGMNKDKYLSLHVDGISKGKPIVKNDGNKPEEIQMSSKVYNLYADMCLRNWDLVSYMHNNSVNVKTIEETIVKDEQRRTDLKNPQDIKRNSSDGGYYYSSIVTLKNGAKVKHNFVEFPGKEPVDLDE